MSSQYPSNIQPLQGCDIQFMDDRGFTPTVIQIVPLRGTIYFEIKRISSNWKLIIQSLKFNNTRPVAPALFMIISKLFLKRYILFYLRIAQTINFKEF